MSYRYPGTLNTAHGTCTGTLKMQKDLPSTVHVTRIRLISLFSFSFRNAEISLRLVCDYFVTTLHRFGFKRRCTHGTVCKYRTSIGATILSLRHAALHQLFCPHFYSNIHAIVLNVTQICMWWYSFFLIELNIVPPFLNPMQ